MALEELNEVEKINATLYPNHTKEEVSLELHNEQYNICVLNVLGSVLKRISTNFSVIEIDFEAYSSGVYFIKILNKKTNKFEIAKV